MRAKAAPLFRCTRQRARVATPRYYAHAPASMSMSKLSFFDRRQCRDAAVILATDDAADTFDDIRFAERCAQMTTVYAAPDA